MNLEMMILTDCIEIFAQGISNQDKDDLLSFVASMGKVCEVRAVAYKDVSSADNSKAANLYKAWFLT